MDSEDGEAPQFFIISLSEQIIRSNKKSLFVTIAGGFQTFYVYIIISSMKVRKVLKYENEKNCKSDFEQGVEGSERKCNDRP